MCTLIAAVGVFPSYRLVIAANRDEDLRRPSSAPFIWAEKRPFLAPRDDVAGGTWLGLNDAGLFVGVTNRMGPAKDPERSSRGLLVTDALGSPDAEILHQRLANLTADRFNAFHLFYSAGHASYVTWSDGEKLAQETLPRGVHVITERSLGGDDRARTELIRQYWAAIRSEDTLVDELPKLMRLHAAEPLGGTCVHLPELHYGTRSSMIVLLASSLQSSRFFWADGSPCSTPYREQSHLLRQLAQLGPSRPP